MFLTSTVTLWYYQYDRNSAAQFIWQTVFSDKKSVVPLLERLWQQTQSYTTLRNLLPNNSEITQQFSKFLYDKQHDYESDLATKRAPGYFQRDLQACEGTRVLRRSSGDKNIELGNDDGSAEWRTYLASDQVRVKKVFCLPKNIDDYNSAALKIFMNNGGSGDFIALISFNNYLIQQYNPVLPVPRESTWHEIPFDKKLLQGHSRIHVYVRVTNASGSGKYLQIWGDQDTPTIHSVFNHDTTDDLSLDKDVQTGEYMIRLVLRK